MADISPYLIKTLLGDTSDSIPDEIIDFYYSKAINAIKKYCNIEIVPVELTNQSIELAVFYYNNKSTQGMTSMSQGNRQQSMIDGIPKSITDTLPYPKVKVM